MNHTAMIVTVLSIALSASGLSSWAQDVSPPANEKDGYISIAQKKDNQESPEMEKQFPGVFELVKNSDVLDETEKQYWFDVLPQMTREQVERLTGLLGKGRDKRDGLEENYRKQLDELNRQNLDK